MIIPIDLKERSYNIIIERGLLAHVDDYIPTHGKTLIVTDTGVPSVYAKTVASRMQDAFIYTIEQGEGSKNLNNYQQILAFMLEKGFTRKDKVLAVGGGVVGDLSGFVAASYMRGIDFYNLPTTLLSQVDSSIGGKVAVDFGGVKNSVGAFYQPKGVLIDTQVLETLSNRLLYSGLVESIKMALTSNAKLFELIENSKNILADAEEIIYGSLLIKKMVVEQDEKETGLRRVLNFGHTFGHAVESIYDGKLYHGECVGIGMLLMCSDAVKSRLKPLLERFNVPTIAKCDAKKLNDLVWHDKKAQGKVVVGVFVDEIGSFEFVDLTSGDVERLSEKLI